MLSRQKASLMLLVLQKRSNECLKSDGLPMLNCFLQFKKILEKNLGFYFKLLQNNCISSALMQSQNKTLGKVGLDCNRFKNMHHTVYFEIELLVFFSFLPVFHLHQVDLVLTRLLFGRTLQNGWSMNQVDFLRLIRFQLMLLLLSFYC